MSFLIHYDENNPYSSETLQFLKTGAKTYSVLTCISTWIKLLKYFLTKYFFSICMLVKYLIRLQAN